MFEIEEWTLQGRRDVGFTGFAPFARLPATAVPSDAGVYVVARDSSDPTVFVVSSVAGWFRRKDPSLDLTRLAEAWVPGAVALYIGKASGGAAGGRGLQKRLDEYRRHGAGQPVGHWGGRYIWQLADAGELLVAWLPTSQSDPEDVESKLLSQFANHFGRRPFANRKMGRAAVLAEDS